jgi:hypothetical protein
MMVLVIDRFLKIRPVGSLAGSLVFVKVEKRNLPRIQCGETPKWSIHRGVGIRLNGGGGREIMILILQERERIWG